MHHLLYAAICLGLSLWAADPPADFYGTSLLFKQGNYILPLVKSSCCFPLVATQGHWNSAFALCPWSAGLNWEAKMLGWTGIINRAFRQGNTIRLVQRACGGNCNREGVGGGDQKGMMPQTWEIWGSSQSQGKTNSRYEQKSN